MPRYRIIAPLPEVLEYKTARYILRQYDSLYSMWCWVAQKDQDSKQYSAVILLRGRTPQELEDSRRTGFDVAPGGGEDKIMQRLVRDGVAELIG